MHVRPQNMAVAFLQAVESIIALVYPIDYQARPLHATTWYTTLAWVDRISFWNKHATQLL